jgi:hypothetical protein
VICLRPDGVYLLPNGSQVIARLGSKGEFVLHNPRKGVAAAPEYLVAPSGQLLSWVRKTNWTRTDLRDTGLSCPEIQRFELL